MTTLVRLALFVFLFIAVLPVAGNDFCMDCTHRLVEGPGEEILQDADCCMAWDGHCYTNDWMVNQNVGNGCRVSEAAANGWTYCQSTQDDLNCQGGADKKKAETVIGESGCVYDQHGWCDTSCSSCTWG